MSDNLSLVIVYIEKRKILKGKILQELMLPLVSNAFEFKCTTRGNAQFQKVQKFWSLSKNSWHMHV